MEVIDRYLERLGREGLIFRMSSFKTGFIPAEEIEGGFIPRSLVDLRPHEPAGRTTPGLLKNWKKKKKPWVEDEIELLDAETYQRGA